jgi:hypothetical protein
MSAALVTPPAVEPAKPILAVNNVEVIYDHVILVLKGVSVLCPEAALWPFWVPMVRARPRR